MGGCNNVAEAGGPVMRRRRGARLGDLINRRGRTIMRVSLGRSLALIWNSPFECTGTGVVWTA